MASASLLPFGPAAPGVFDRVASRRLRPQGSEWVLEAEGVRAYLPSLLRLLRDADESKVCMIIRGMRVEGPTFRTKPDTLGLL